VSPIDYLCRDCGASFEVGVGSLLTDDYQPGCPACDSEDVQTDWDAVANRFGDTVAELPEVAMTPTRFMTNPT
jgi:DNA-directed RNA polymerase subunit RPC12/RpoP